MIEREVMRWISHTIHTELIKLAVQDAPDQRKPRWWNARLPRIQRHAKLEEAWPPDEAIS